MPYIFVGVGAYLYGLYDSNGFSYTKLFLVAGAIGGGYYLYKKAK